MVTRDPTSVRAVLHLRPDERERLDKAARAADYRSTVEYIRRTALREADVILRREAAQG